MTSSKEFRVLADYEVNDPRPLTLAKGVSVRIVKTDQSWPGWSWVEGEDQAGWIPDDFIDKESAETLRDFNGMDLSARRNEIIEAVEEAPGWIYAKNSEGDTGWFPLFNLRPRQ